MDLNQARYLLSKISRMKTIKLIAVVIVFVLATSGELMSQNPPHPNGGGGPGGGNTPVGGGAPLDGGFTLLLVLGSAYAYKSWLELKTASVD